MRDETNAGGLWCREVLERLDDYVDDRLTSDERGEVEAHLAQCQRCASFGGAVAEMIAAIRKQLAEPPPLPPTLHRQVVSAVKGSGGERSD